MYHKESAHTIMEGKSQGPHPVSWRSQELVGYFLAEYWQAQHPGSQSSSLGPKARTHIPAQGPQAGGVLPYSQESQFWFVLIK